MRACICIQIFFFKIVSFSVFIKIFNNHKLKIFPSNTQTQKRKKMEDEAMIINKHVMNKNNENEIM